MAGLTIRPGSDYVVGTVTFNGGPTTGYQCVNDAVNNDSTYITANTGIGWPKAFIRMKPVAGGMGAISASSRILRVRLNARIRANATTSTLGTLKLAITNPKKGSYDGWETHQTNDAITYSTRFGTWRNKPPYGFGDEWTINAIESCAVEALFQPAAWTGVNLRLSELFIDVEYRDPASVSNVVITNPAATTEPTVTWQYNSNSDGDPQVAYQVKVFSSQQYTQWGFNPERFQPVWDSGIVTSNAREVVVSKRLENGQTYAAYVRVASDFGGQKWWTSYVNSFPQTIILTPLPQPAMVGLVADPVQYRNRIDVQSNLNHLQVQSADFNNAFLGTGDWSAFFGGATLARVTTPTAEGAGAMSVTKALGAGDFDILTSGGNTGFKVKAGQHYTALASFRSAATPRQIQVGVAWADRAGNSLGITLGTSVTTSTSSWIQASYSGTAPAGAVYGAVWIKGFGAALSEVHYVDKVHFGTGVTIGSGTIAGASGTSRPQVAAKYDSGYWSNPSKTFTCKDIPAGSLLVAATASGRSASVTTNVVTSTGGLTWTNRRENGTANTGDVSVSTAYYAAGGTIDVTVTGNAGNARTLVYAVTGHDEATYGGAHNMATGTSGSANVSLTTTRENSLVIVVAGDYNEINGNFRNWKKPGVDFVEDFYGDFGESVVYFSHQHISNAGANTFGLNSPSGQAYGIVAIEVRGASFNTAQTVYTGWSKGGWIGQVSTVVERALVSTGARNNAHPQLWSGGDWYKNTDGFYLPEGQRESFLTYDVTTTYDGQGCIRWDVNNWGSRLYMGWPDGPRWIAEPQEPLLGIEGKTYTFGIYAKADTNFDSRLTIQALEQFGGPVGSPASSSITIGTSWQLFTVTFTMPTGCLWVRADLENSSSVVERRVWVDGIQWCEGTTVDTIPGFGEGIAVDWQPIRNAGPDDFKITDTSNALIESVWDTEAKPGCGYVYRAYNYLPASETVPALSSPVTFYATNKLNSPGRGVWILRDPNDNSLSLRLHVVGMSETMHEESATFYPLRPTTWDQLGQRAVTITDFIGGFDGSLKVICDSEAEWRILRQLLSRPRPMYLIFPEHGARYVRITDRSWDRSSARTDQMSSDSVWRREVTLNFLESDAP
jgi:hypothetical protein